MIVVVPGYDDYADVIGTKGFGGKGVGKVSAGIQAGRLGYQLAHKAYQRYFGYVTKTPNRATATAVGAGIGLSGGIVALLKEGPQSTPYQNRQTRNYMVKSRSKRIKCYKYPNMARGAKRRQRQFY